MSAEVVPIRPAEVDAPGTPGVAEIPEHVVLMIARAAVEAYKDGLREKRNADQRAYYRVNRERILEAQRLRRETKRRHDL